MIDILQKADREQPKIPGEAGFERIQQVEGEYPLSKGEIAEKPLRLTKEQIKEQVARIEAGEEPTVPKEMLKQAVAEAIKSDKPSRQAVLEATLRHLQDNVEKGESRLITEDSAAVREFVEELEAATGPDLEKQ